MLNRSKFCAMKLCVAALGLLLPAVTTFAQGVGPSIKPRPGVSNTTSNELRNIYRDDVGDGLSSQSLNQLSLANARARVENYGQASFGQQSGSQARLPTLAPSGPSSKPFSQVGTSPAVSPYLNLFRDDFDGGGDFNYQTLVRPQFQQIATNQQFQRQNNELSQRVQSISAQSAFQNPAGSETQYPTGHQTAFGYYGTFYPGMSRPRGK
jgi:hypothetical protein